jgi:formylglycine-generating enzyme required for sulfatase activity/serine/threonine protein kinase
MRYTDSNWPRDALPKGTELHGYLLDGIIGRGGFGITYRAIDAIDQVFAIKECFPKQFAVREGKQVLPTDAMEEEPLADCLSRFMKEARALRQLSTIGAAGEGVVKVATFFQANGTAYIVMEYLGGGGLDTLIKANPRGLPEPWLNDVLPRLLHALACVHDAGLLHRDIKPANILFRDDGRPVLIDFGAVREMSHGLTRTFTQIYSEGYAPIEQFSGTRQGPYSDIYALGATFYRAIGGTTVDSFTRHQALLRGRPDPQRAAVEIGAGRYARQLLGMIDAALTVAPEDRPQTVGALIALMAPVADDTTVRDPRRAKLVPATTAAPLPGEAVPATANDAEPTRRVTEPAPTPGVKPSFRWYYVGFALIAAIFGINELNRRYGSGGQPDRVAETTAAPPPATAVVPRPAPTASASGGFPTPVGGTFRDCSNCPELVVIPAGRFLMGSAASAPGHFPDERPQHDVVVGAPLAVGKYTVTFAEWDTCVAAGGCSTRPSDEGWGRDRHPAINVSWQDAQTYTHWLSEKTRHTYRLLTEAEWEYAARSGTVTAYSFGATVSPTLANYADSNLGRTQPVGRYPPNSWGLYDMQGNVGQWVQDCDLGNYNNAPSDAAIAEDGPCMQMVVRGGSWFNGAAALRTAYRGGATPSTRASTIGFRLARTADR